MFSSFSLYVLMFSALVSLATDIFNPFLNLSGKLRGKSKKILDAEVESTIYIYDEQGKKVTDFRGEPEINWGKVGEKIDGWCIGSCLYSAIMMPLASIIKYVVVPFFAFTAINKSIGIVYLAYATI